MNPTPKPNAPACERNRDPILAVLQTHFAAVRTVLEIGSGTGQHAVYFAQALPHLRWQSSDIAENLPGINAWVDSAALANTPPPVELNVENTWPEMKFEAVFSANTLHIMSWPQVQTLFRKIPTVLVPGGVLAVYGPFNYGGRFTSASNADFNQWLLARGSHMAIRDFEAVDALAVRAGLTLMDDIAMPANNRVLIWRADAVSQTLT